jgi:hypothetical protein
MRLDDTRCVEQLVHEFFDNLTQRGEQMIDEERGYLESAAA